MFYTANTGAGILVMDTTDKAHTSIFSFYMTYIV